MPWLIIGESQQGAVHRKRRPFKPKRHFEQAPQTAHPLAYHAAGKLVLLQQLLKRCSTLFPILVSVEECLVQKRAQLRSAVVYFYLPLALAPTAFAYAADSPKSVM
jgi:hypothetical protein